MGTFISSFLSIKQFVTRTHKYTFRTQAKPYVSSFSSENQTKWRLLPCLNNGHLQLGPIDHSRPSMIIDFSHLMNLRRSPRGHLQIPFYTCTSSMVYRDSIRHCHQHSYYIFYKNCAFWPSRNKKNVENYDAVAEAHFLSLCHRALMLAWLESKTW
jgi:hypothetical protein